MITAKNKEVYPIEGSVKQPFHKTHGWQWILGLVVLVLVGIISYLMWNNYKIHHRMQAIAMQEVGEDLVNRSRAINYFFQERANDIRDIADSNLVRAYFRNKALGMTYTYGLKGSLEEIERRLRDLNASTKFRSGDESAVYERLALFSVKGELLANYQEKASSPVGHYNWDDIQKQMPHRQAVSGEVIIMPQHWPLCKIFIAPVRNGNTIKGYIAGWVMFDIIYQRFLRNIKVVDSPQTRTFNDILIYNTKAGWHVADNLDGLLLEQLERQLPQEKSAHSEPMGNDGTGRLPGIAQDDDKWMHFFSTNHPHRPNERLIGVVTQLDDAIYLFRILPQKILIGTKEAFRQQLLLGLIILTIISLTLFVLRYGTLTRSLKSRLDEANRLQTEIRYGNDSLTREVERRKSVEAKLQEANERLEQRVRERTLEIEQMQGQLVMQEKMAAVGQLAAGVAHEINNPVGFVSSNLTSLSDYLTDITGLMEQYDRLLEKLKGHNGTIDEGAKALIHDVETMKSQVDIGFILKDISDLFAESTEGLERVKKIVLDLKDFAHPGEHTKRDADINKGLDSTLNVAWNELKYKARIVKDYGDIPLVNCYPDQLNQVFMNLLVNAAQAIEKQGDITITTRADDNWVKISISDTGCGIPEDNLSRLFDPFFTTKKIGQGTGLGLNMAYNIVRNHGGSIDVESVEGQGTTFTVRLPLQEA
ncbi:MAG: ATP-binding protein [Thermodesulfobacteriota bacterium]|nr:ATP-binding protein [Thermodesulfobacteriota bacterium]